MRYVNHHEDRAWNCETLDIAWRRCLETILTFGEYRAPRGKPTKALYDHGMLIDMKYPVLTFPSRKLSYKFMAANAYWMLSGRNDVGFLKNFNPRISQFSDDGFTFDGAYGPQIVQQLRYVVDCLINDSDTRQAVLTTWRPNPRPSKDIPCTLAFIFRIDQNRNLNLHVTMRSSDAWLGVPYDVFDFSMVAAYVVALANTRLSRGIRLELGDLYLMAVNRHLYEPDWAAAQAIVLETNGIISVPRPIPRLLYADGADPDGLLAYLVGLTGTAKGDPMRWWEPIP